ncbi:hypothetical protein KQH82_06120 [bacterium]|nr:hypothetical protein [bacterium]
MKKVLRQIWNGWMRFARVVGRVNTAVLLTLFYFLILSPLGAVMRLFGWDPLRTGRKARKAESNWQTVRDGSPDLDSLERQS